MIESAQDQHIRELEDAIAATDKLLADIQQRVAQLENHTAAPWPHPPVYDASAVIKSFNNPTVDELHKRIKDLEEQLSYALEQTTRSPSVTEFKWVCPDNEQTSDLKKQIYQLTHDRDTLAKRLADICNIAKNDT